MNNKICITSRINNIIQSLFVLVFTLIISFSLSNTIHAKSGCCSWHDGVSHCDTSTGRYVCNDGTYSPSCTCTVYKPSTYEAPSYTPPVRETPSYSVPVTNTYQPTDLGYSYTDAENDSDDSAVLASSALIGGGLLAYVLRKKK